MASLLSKSLEYYPYMNGINNPSFSACQVMMAECFA